MLDHVARLQVLVVDGVVLAQQLKRCLVVEVRSLPLHLQMGPGQQLDLVLAPVASLCAAGHPALAAPQISLGLALAARILDHRAVG